MSSIKRSYRILGLPPGAPRDEIKRAYLDLAQVWHPDRFSHNPRLRAKAEDNLKRINAAYEILQAYDPPEARTETSALSRTYSAILGLGDLVRSGAIRRPREAEPGRSGRSERRPGGPRVVGLGPLERTGELRKARRRSRAPLYLGIAAAMLAATMLLVWL